MPVEKERVNGKRTSPVVSSRDELKKLPLFDRKGWKILRFGDVVENVNETVRAPAEAGIERFIGLEHLEPGSLHIREWGNVADGTTFTRRCRPGQLLFGKRRAYQRKVAVAEFDAVVSGDIYVLAPKGDRLLPELLPFLCLSERFFQHAVGTSAGSLSPRTNWSSLASFEFVLPPLDQQRRIADILWAVDETYLANEQAIQSANEAIDAQLDDAFGTEGNGTERIRFPTIALSAVTFLQTGIAKGKRYPATVPTTEMPYLRVANVQDGHLNLSEIKTIVVSKAEETRFKLRDGDVVICEGGDFDKVGRGTIWRGQVPNCLHQNHVFCLRANRAVLLPEFLTLQLGSAYGKRYFLGCAKKTSNLASINSTQVKAFPLQHPKLAEQLRIVREAEKLQSTRDALTSHLNATYKLSNMLTEAFA